MIKCHLVSEEGVIFPIERRVTIGRRPDNDIHLSHPSISRRHAEVYVKGQQVIVEDLSSLNGTFVNGLRVEEATLTNGDILKFGRITFRFVQEEEMPRRIDLTDTQEVSKLDDSKAVLGEGYLLGPADRIEAISLVPLFASLDKEALDEISQAAQFIVAKRGRTIVRQGGLDRSFYIILDGKVMVFNYDNEGKAIQLAILSENDYFGEFSLLRGGPRTAMVQAVEKTLLCKLSFEAIRRIFKRFPVIRVELEQRCRERLKEREAIKQKAGFVERRKQTRYLLKFPVRFSVSPISLVSDKLRGKTFVSSSMEVSTSGVRLEVNDPSLRRLSMGCQLNLEIVLPQPWGFIRCLGTLHSMFEEEDSQGLWSLGIEFTEMDPAQREKLNQFLCG